MRPIVALMMSRDEADVVAEVVESWRAWDIPVLAIDDSSDGTYDILKSYDHVAVWRQDEFCPPGEKGTHNWVLNPLLERKRERFGPIVLGDMKPGETRVLKQAELNSLREALGLEPMPKG